MLLVVMRTRAHGLPCLGAADIGLFRLFYAG